jgi:hypothetical protein
MAVSMPADEVDESHCGRGQDDVAAHQQPVRWPATADRRQQRDEHGLAVRKDLESGARPNHLGLLQVVEHISLIPTSRAHEPDEQADDKGKSKRNHRGDEDNRRLRWASTSWIAHVTLLNSSGVGALAKRAFCGVTIEEHHVLTHCPNRCKSCRISKWVTTSKFKCDAEVSFHESP